MDKYRVDYMDNDGEIITVEIETRAMVETQGSVLFLDEHGENIFKFNKKDLIQCKEVFIESV